MGDACGGFEDRGMLRTLKCNILFTRFGIVDEGFPRYSSLGEVTSARLFTVIPVICLSVAVTVGIPTPRSNFGRDLDRRRDYRDPIRADVSIQRRQVFLPFGHINWLHRRMGRMELERHNGGEVRGTLS